MSTNELASLQYGQTITVDDVTGVLDSIITYYNGRTALFLVLVSDDGRYVVPAA